MLRTVVPVCTSLATSIVAVLVEEASTALRALRDTITVDIGVHLDTANVTLQLVFVLDSPAHDIHVDGLVWEPFKASEHTDPLVVLLLQRSLNTGALSSSNGRITLPADAVVDLALSGDDLVVTVVLEAERIGVGLDFVLPYLLKAGLEVGGRVPGLLGEVAFGRGCVGPGGAVVEAEGFGLKGTYRGGCAAVDVGVHVARNSASEGTSDEGGDSESGLHFEEMVIANGLVAKSMRTKDAST